MWSIELFAGAGGLALGVSRSGLTPAVIVEWDKWCCDTIRENQDRLVDPVLHWPRPVEGDVRAVKFHKFRGQIELVAGVRPVSRFRWAASIAPAMMIETCGRK